MTPFLVSVVAIQCILLFAMYAVVAQLLARVRNTETVLAKLSSPASVVPSLVLGEPMPSVISNELGPQGPGTTHLHLSSGGCASCKGHVAALAGNGVRQVVVAADSDDLMVLPIPGGIDTAVSPTLLLAARRQNLALPIVVETTDGVVTDVRRPAPSPTPLSGEPPQEMQR